MRAKWTLLAAMVIGVLMFSMPAFADFVVFVGYADNIRPSPFFPNPWNGSPNTTFNGGEAGGVDAGGILVQNTGSVDIKINALTVDQFENGASFTIWNGFIGAGQTVGAGKFAIFTQTVCCDFDTSDLPIHGLPPSSATPHVKITIDGSFHDLVDSGQVLNTEGSDALAQAGLNESHQWRPIGTFGGQGGAPPGSVPEPSSVLLLGTGLGAMVFALRRKARKQFLA